MHINCVSVLDGQYNTIHNRMIVKFCTNRNTVLLKLLVMISV